LRKDVSNISDTLPISQIDYYLSQNLGLHFSQKRRHDLERGLTAAGLELGFDNLLEFTRWLIASPPSRKTVEALASHLTVGETYFFRDDNYFRTLEEHLLAELHKAPASGIKRLKIWSAGCSTGEEPYSIAILLSKFTHIIRDWNVTILASDINPLALKKASRGVYNEWSFRGTPEWVKQKYFRKIENGYWEIQPFVKKMVKFFYLNLAEDSYPSYINNTSEVDIIFCRNVLMYFGVDQREMVVQRLRNSLVEGGWLAVSPSEMSQELFSQFSAVNLAGTVVYRKDTTAGISIARSFTKTVPAGPSERPEAVLTEQAPEKPVNPISEEQVQKDRDELLKSAFELYECCRYKEVTEKLTIALSSTSANHDQASGNEKSLALMARANANLGKLNDARVWCEKAIALNKLEPGLYYLLATILQEQNQLEEAITALNRALYLNQDYLPAHFALGNLQRQLGRQEEALKHFEHSLMILSSYAPGDLLPDSDGMTAGRLSEMIVSMML
jgi:chemotaxis protein methyltransferase CheR